MSSVPKPSFITPQEYLGLERKAETKSEYYRGEMFAMFGASYFHGMIKDNISEQARRQLRGGPCRVVTSDLRVKVDATGLYCYPDVVIVCEEPDFDDTHFDTLKNPKVLIEVLSQSTEQHDRGFKLRQFTKIDSLHEYVLVSQYERLVERYTRKPDGDWSFSLETNPAAAIQFASVPVRLTLAEIYENVELPDQPPR